MKKLLLLMPAMLLGITLSATLYDKDEIVQAVRAIDQDQDQVSACVNKKNGDACEYTQIKKMVCDPILLKGALMNPCKVTGTNKITGICREKAISGSAFTDTRLGCQEEPQENK